MSKIKTLKTILKTIHKHDPEEAYKNMMLRAFQNHKISQLGLAKIRYECNAEIKLNTISRITKKYRSYIGPDTLLGNIKLDNDKKIIKITVLTDIIK